MYCVETSLYIIYHAICIFQSLPLSALNACIASSLFPISSGLLDLPECRLFIPVGVYVEAQEVKAPCSLTLFNINDPFCSSPYSPSEGVSTAKYFNLPDSFLVFGCHTKPTSQPKQNRLVLVLVLQLPRRGSTTTFQHKVLQPSFQSSIQCISVSSS